MEIIQASKEKSYTIILSIAGSDSSGGAGIQADIKTISALGCYAATAITAVTVQNTMGVSAVHSIPADIVIAQAQAVLLDMPPAAIKIGMIHSAHIALSLAQTLKSYPGIPVVFDPVMVATSGDLLMEKETIAVITENILPITKLLTPNLHEAAVLAKMPVSNIKDMQVAAGKIIKYGSFAVLIKGGHLKGTDLCDVYFDQNGVEKLLHSPAISSINTHGTGCSLSSAIASYIGIGEDLDAAILKGKSYIHQAILQGKDVKTGHGQGPLNHFFAPEPLKIKYS
jgi:hydroxymethylpyrimidine/phosphomethylpyrimidine kinase